MEPLRAVAALKGGMEAHGEPWRVSRSQLLMVGIRIILMRSSSLKTETNPRQSEKLYRIRIEV